MQLMLQMRMGAPEPGAPLLKSRSTRRTSYPSVRTVDCRSSFIVTRPPATRALRSRKSSGVISELGVPLWQQSGVASTIALRNSLATLPAWAASKCVHRTTKASSSCSSSENVSLLMMFHAPPLAIRARPSSGVFGASTRPDGALNHVCHSARASAFPNLEKCVDGRRRFSRVIRLRRANSAPAL